MVILNGVLDGMTHNHSNNLHNKTNAINHLIMASRVDNNMINHLTNNILMVKLVEVEAIMDSRKMIDLGTSMERDNLLARNIMEEKM